MTEQRRPFTANGFGNWMRDRCDEAGLPDCSSHGLRKHDAISEENGPYIANGSVRTFRAIYNHARKTNRELLADNPVDSVDWNHEKRRDTGMGVADLKGWFVEAAKLDNPIRREFHLFTLLSASRPAAG